MSADTPISTPLPSAAPLTITNGSLVEASTSTNGPKSPVDLVARGGRLVSIEPAAASTPTDGPTIDAEELFVAPGFVDLQINGGYGIDLWSEPDALWDLGRRLPSTGVTAFCPTIVSGPPDRIDTALAALAHPPEHHLGARPLGLHLEGPMLAPRRRGAHDQEWLRPADPTLVDGWTVEAGVRLVTLAPELPGATVVIERLRSAGVVVAAGHSEATSAQSQAAEAAGVSLVTHLFNAMAPLHHRRPGLVGHTLGPGRLAAGMIVDGIHVDPTVVALVARALGPDRLVLVSDAVAAMGLPPGEHRFGGRGVTVDDGGVRRPDGTLAGSDLALDQAVRNLMTFAGWEAVDAIGCASANPARVLGIDRDRGRLRAGAVADVVLLDRNLSVVATVCEGRLAHLRPSARERLSGAEPPPPAPA